MKTCAEIVTPEQVVLVHAHANFGDMSKREVVDVGVLTYAFGYDTGHTMMTILQEHGLLSRSRTDRRLTKKGYEYLRAMFFGVPLKRINELRSFIVTVEVVPK